MFRARRLAVIAGVPVRADLSLFLIAALAAWWLETWFAAPGRSAVTVWAMAATGSVLFLGSVLAHELGHALEARHRGIEVIGIRLFAFGGVTSMRSEASRPAGEFAVAAVGPWVSLVVAATGGLVATALSGVEAPGARAAAEIAGALGWMNLFLGIFNLLPGSPLDGGRILRSLIWAVTRNRERANRVAARAGMGLALVLVAGAVYSVAVRPVLDPLWTGLIALLIWNGARAELQPRPAEDETAGAPEDGTVGAPEDETAGAPGDGTSAAPEDAGAAATPDSATEPQPDPAATGAADRREPSP